VVVERPVVGPPSPVEDGGVEVAIARHRGRQIEARLYEQCGASAEESVRPPRLAKARGSHGVGGRTDRPAAVSITRVTPIRRVPLIPSLRRGETRNQRWLAPGIWRIRSVTRRPSKDVGVKNGVVRKGPTTIIYSCRPNISWTTFQGLNERMVCGSCRAGSI